MKLFVFGVLITVWVMIIAKKNKKHYVRDSFINTQGQYSVFDLRGSLRRSFFLLSGDGEPQSNILCSPLSALLPLGKLALGAEGNSLNELLDAIGVSNKSKAYIILMKSQTNRWTVPRCRSKVDPRCRFMEKKILHGSSFKLDIKLQLSMIKEFYKPLLTRLRYLPGVKLNIASRLLMSDHAHLHRGFKKAAVEAFQSSVEQLNFTYPSYAAEEINSWISTQTNGIIKNMLDPSDISPMTSIILVNAIYFNGHWKKPFKKVSNVTFHYSTSSQENIEMMMREDVFNYTKSEGLASKIISIPYSGGSASLVVVCPEARGGLAALMAVLRLTVDVLAEAMLTMKPTPVKLTMPKFKLHSEFDLGQVYLKMGLKTIFNKAQSGLTKIVRDDTVYISKAKHKCFIDVNEYGTEAAASSVVNMAKMSYVEPIELLVDHPFLYFILVNDQQLFSGTFVKPHSHI